MSLSNFLGAHSFAKWKPVSAEGLSEREQIRFFVLSTGWGTEGNAQTGRGPWPLSQAPHNFQSWRAVSGRLYGAAAPPRRGQQPSPLPTSCPVFEAR